MFCTKKTTQSWFLPPPKKKSEARQLFGTTIVWHMYVQSWQQQLLSQELRSACYGILFLSLHFRFWCYHLLSESLGGIEMCEAWCSTNTSFAGTSRRCGNTNPSWAAFESWDAAIGCHASREWVTKAALCLRYFGIREITSDEKKDTLGV